MAYPKTMSSPEQEIVPLPVVLNKHRDKIPPGAVYIGRGSLWGNPYPLKEYGNDRVKVLGLYRDWLEKRLADDPAFRVAFRHLAAAPAFVCFCKPALCHGDVILEKLAAMGLVTIPSQSPPESAGTESA